ncbi:DUF4238 domain-containing protein [Priestia aryabhattai]|uniref:DUF4238 domain-containing protein n=1 Tax=Priestia aryabhattai TaxID=412384 RepID=UPI003D2D7FC5
MENNPVKQHTTPKTYLKHFTFNKKCTFVYDRLKKKLQKRNIEKLTVIKDFYTFVDEEGNNRYDMEKFLGNSVESNYNKFVEFVNNGILLQKVHKEMFSIYIAAQYMRTPKAKSQLYKEIENAYKEGNSGRLFDAEDITMFDKDYTLDGEKITYEEFIKKRDGMGIYINIKEGVHVKYMAHRLLGIADGFAERKWLILEAPKNAKFITCDNPIVNTNEFEDLKLTALSGDIFIISEHFAVAMGDNWDGYYELDSTDVEYINHSLVLNSDRYFFSSEEKLLRENVKLLSKESIYS